MLKIRVAVALKNIKASLYMLRRSGHSGPGSRGEVGDLAMTMTELGHVIEHRGSVVVVVLAKGCVCLERLRLCCRL